MLCHFMLFIALYLDRCYYQGDCGRFFSHILADVIAIGVWDDINTHSYDLMLTTLADVDANFLSVVDVETTIF